MKSSRERLNIVGLKVTPVRLEVLDYFVKEDKVLSHADIENYYKGKLDRVTLYRTLSTFIENGILHKIVDDSAVAKYAICKHNQCRQHKHEDNHVHFKCSSCGKIECLHELTIPSFNLPKNYKMESANLLIDGICADCN